MAVLAFAGAFVVQPVSGRDVVVSWQETVALESQDRRKRFRDLSRRGALVGDPAFYETLISRRDLPDSFGVDVPVLRVVFPQNVFFETASDQLSAQAERVVDLVASVLRGEASDTAVFVAGHTDSRGSEAYNHALSVRRADTVARALFERGVLQAKIWRVGFGEVVPVRPNSDETNMARNRRVEFLFGRKPEAVAIALARQEAAICTGRAQDRELCPVSVSVLPRVEAVPITAPRSPAATASLPRPETATVVPPVSQEALVRVSPETTASIPVPASPAATGAPRRAPVATAQAPSPAPPAVAASEPPTPSVVTIRPEEPVIIDIQVKQVFVRRPQR